MCWLSGPARDINSTVIRENGDIIDEDFARSFEIVTAPIFVKATIFSCGKCVGRVLIAYRHRCAKHDGRFGRLRRNRTR